MTVILQRGLHAPTLPLIAGLLATLGLSACAEPYTVSAVRCNPAAHNALIGRNVAELILPERLKVAEVGPDDEADSDLDQYRLTLFMDAKGFVTRVACR